MPVVGPPRVATLLAVALTLTTLAAQERRPPSHLVERAGHDGDRFESLVCGTRRADDIRRAAPVPVADGTPVSFVQEPAVLSPLAAGGLRLREFLVAGDLATVHFRRWDVGAVGGAPEVWTRVASRVVDGRIISVFEPAWPDAVVLERLRSAVWGWDYPTVWWGTVLVDGDADSDETEHDVWLRVASTGLPRAEIVRVDDTIQYASHVVNLVVPGFGATRLTGDGRYFVEAPVTRRFYEHFGDDYETIAIVPQAGHLGTYSAYHRHVQNRVAGIGLDLFDTSASYGSAGRLQGVEVYLGAWYATTRTTSHEFAHQWGHFFAWDRIMGLERVGWQPRSHAPLLAPGETYIGSLLRGTRRVEAHEPGGFRVERTPSPIRHHPLELYAMGLLAPEDLPEFVVFEDQAQLGPWISTPLVGTLLTGAIRLVGVNDLMAAHGPRRGPVPETWRVATVLVTRDALASREEMDYWNFFAARLEDESRTGIESYEGYVSTERATGGRVDVQTRLLPTTLPPVDQAYESDAPPFGPGDCPDVVFDGPVPSRYAVREGVPLSARVRVRDRNYSQALLRFWKSGGGEADAVMFWEPVSPSGSLTPRVLFREGEEGMYRWDVFLFWPGAGPQYPRCSLTVVKVE